MVDRTDHGATSAEKQRDHLAHIASYTDREVEKIRAFAGISETSLEQIGGVFKELIRASTTNPLVGACVVVIMANVLVRAKIIDQGTQALVNTFAAVGFGVDVSVSIVDAIGNILGFSSGGNQPGPDVLKPTATTVVFGGESAATKAISAPLGKTGLEVATKDLVPA